MGLGALAGCCVCWKCWSWFGVSVSMGECREWKEAVADDTGALKLSLKDRFWIEG